MAPMKTSIFRIFILSMISTQLLTACGPEYMEGYQGDYDDVLIENVSDNRDVSDLRHKKRRGRRDFSPNHLTCEDRDFELYESFTDVSDKWNTHVTTFLGAYPGASFTVLKDTFTQDYCPQHLPFIIWADGPPTCMFFPAPTPTQVPNMPTVSYEANSSTNPAVIRYRGCLYPEAQAEIANL